MSRSLPYKDLWFWDETTQRARENPQPTVFVAFAWIGLETFTRTCLGIEELLAIRRWAIAIGCANPRLTIWPVGAKISKFRLTYFFVCWQATDINGYAMAIRIRSIRSITVVILSITSRYLLRWTFYQSAMLPIGCPIWIYSTTLSWVTNW